MCHLEFLLVSVNVSLISGFCFGIITVKLSEELSTFLCKVTLIVEGKLVHLHQSAPCIHILDHEVLVSLSTTDREVDVALVLVGCLQNIRTHIVLFINEYPLVRLRRSILVAVEVGSIDLPALPVTVLITIGITACYQTIISRLNRFVSLEDHPARQAVRAPLGSVTVTVDKHAVILTAEAAGAAKSGICSIDRIIHFLDIGIQVFGETLSLCQCLGTGKLAISLDECIVTCRIGVVRSDNVSLANPCVGICLCIILQVVIINEVDGLITNGNQFGILAFRGVNLVSQIIDSRIKLTQGERIRANLQILNSLGQLVNQCLLGEHIGIKVERIQDAIAVNGKCIKITE